MKTRQYAFTLIEMLVVLAIIGLLSGLVFAVLGPAREKARESVCVSNLHQIGQALAMYRADYDGVEAIEGQPMSYSQLGLPSLRMFDTFTKTYVKNRQVLLCPDYHNDTPLDRLTSTYFWSADVDEHDSEYNQFSHIVAMRGGNIPLLICESHNPPLNIAKEPRWVLKKVLFLRLNQQIQVKQVPLRLTYEKW